MRGARTAPPARLARFGLLLAVWLASGSGAASAAAAPAAWVELAADGSLSVRTAVPLGTGCPRVMADGVAAASAVRGAPGDAFPVVCEARVPVRTAHLTANGAALPTLKAEVRRIAVFGDTGCRITGKALQDCRDPKAWPFPVIAKSVAERRPDLVIHVGDYYYRERRCPAGNAGCAGSPYGDNWPTWQAELFDPAAPLLAAAPWVMVRGNHELCNRGGAGWFRLLHPYPPRAACVDRTEPYRLLIGGLALLPFDDADADDFRAPSDKVAAFSGELAPLLAAAPPHSWLLLHRPVWAMAQGELTGLATNQTMQQAINGHVTPALDLVLSGHLHDFLSYAFGPQRPAQLIVGTGGDNLLPLGHAPIVGAEIDGMTVRRGFAAERFAYLILDRTAAGWDGTLYAPDDSVITRCTIAGREIDCR